MINREESLYRFETVNVMYEGRLKSSWIGGSEPLLCRGRR
jgi:hypothetical protein